MVKMRLLAGLLALLLFLCMAHPCAGASGREMVMVFKGGQTDVPFKEKNGAITKIKPLSFRLPAFVGGVVNCKEFLLALCSANYNGYSDRSFIAPAVRTSYGDYKTWSDAEIMAKTTRDNEKQSVLGEATAVIKGNKIYVLVSSWDTKSELWYSMGRDAGWDPLMFVGTVTNRTESNGAAGVYVQWDKGTSLKNLLPNTVLGSTGFQFIGGLGNGIVTKNGTIIFPIQIANRRSQYVSSIMYSTDDGSTWHIGGMTEEGTSQCSVTEWGNGKLLLSARYESGYRKVFESDDMGNTWKESTMLSQVWGNQQYRMGDGSQGSLITVSVERKDILLFSHSLNTKGDSTRDTLQLWMSDGQRIKYVGTISEDGKGERSGYSILAHVGDHLYSMHEINPFLEGKQYNSELEEWDRVIALSSLPDLFHKVKNTASAWRHVDAELTKIHVPTKGLVGFLSGRNDNNVWEDEYNSVNAIVNGATPVEGGFTFDGTAGSGSQWPVQSQGQNKLYGFTKKQFTIAATVTIHKIQLYGKHWLLGASEDSAGTRILMGLGYTQDEGWYVVYSEGIFRNNKVPLVLNKEHQVAITYDNGAFDVYVDGESIMNGRQTTYKESQIMHFYIGGITKSSTENGLLSTVKNVMLYNRVLNKTKIAIIKKVEKYVSQNKSMIMKRQTDTVLSHNSSSATQHTNTLVCSKSDKNVTLNDTKSSLTPHNNETTDIYSHKTHHEDEKDKTKDASLMADTSNTETSKSEERKYDDELKNLKHHSHGGDTKTNDKHVDGAVWTISFSAWMCLSCSAILLAGL